MEKVYIKCICDLLCEHKNDIEKKDLGIPVYNSCKKEGNIYFDSEGKFCTVYTSYEICKATNILILKFKSILRPLFVVFRNH